MAEQFQDWAERQNRTLVHIPMKTMTELMFFRDPTRPHLCDSGYFFSPADGIVLYHKVVQPDEPYEIKGKMFSLFEVFEGVHAPTVPCLVISIFMTFYDVHINRVPYAGTLKFQSLPPISTFNLAMDFAQDDLLAQQFSRTFAEMDYEKYNARMINTFYSPILDYHYYLTQIADNQVNTITHFTVDQDRWFHQNDRFSFVRWGSQVDLVLPIDDRYEFIPTVEEKFHVKGGIDRLVKIHHIFE